MNDNVWRCMDMLIDMYEYVWICMDIYVYGDVWIYREMCMDICVRIYMDI